MLGIDETCFVMAAEDTLMTGKDWGLNNIVFLVGVHPPHISQDCSHVTYLHT
jgi:hypothetical protein